jgi:two-component system, OmpR family, KDP operon response regulator KdpE
MHVLVICDNADEATLVSFALKRAGMTVVPAADLEASMRAYAAEPAELVLLALRELPPVVQVRRLRRQGDACLAVIADAAGEEALCQTYEAGADAVILRPYSLRVLTLQLKALLRRGRGTSLSILPSFVIGKLTLDPSSRTVQVEGRASRRLTQLEFRLLYLLMLHRGQTVPTEVVVERVWGYEGEADGGTEILRALVRRLRAKVEPDPKEPHYILSEPTVGYRLEVPD